MEARERESRVFPEEGKEEVILSMALTQDFLIYSTQVCLMYLYLYFYRRINAYVHVYHVMHM